jgi:hypothetical protein
MWIGSARLLKVGSVRWRGKCPRHPSYNPVVDGPGAIRGNCGRCHLLLEIHTLHQRAIRLMREFQPIERKTKAETAEKSQQLSLFFKTASG